MKLLPFLLLFIPGLTVPALAAPDAEQATAAALPCDMPADLITPGTSMPHVAAALARRGTVEILALGSGSTVGDSGGSSGPAFAVRTPEASFPFRMLDTLQVTRQASQFRLTVKGGRNMTAEAMGAILQQELAAHHYDLVLWQTGTVEAVRGSRPDALRSVLEDGITAAVAAGADVVLVDPQFSRFLRANTDTGPYEGVLQQIASLPDVSLFRRFDLTRNWVSSGQIDLERVPHDQREKTIALLNTCLGHALANYVLSGAGEHEAPPVR